MSTIPRLTEWIAPQEQQSLDIIKSAFNGDIETLLENASEAHIHQGLIVQLQVGDSRLPLHLTPLFAAAVAGRAQMVKSLKNRGASSRSTTGEDLFTWTCLCTDPEKRKAVLEHVDVSKAYKALLLDNNTYSSLWELKNSPSHFLTPFNISVLADTTFSPNISVEAEHLICSSQFRGMTSLELTTYRIAIAQLLKGLGMDIPEENLHSNRIFVALQLGDLEAVKEFDIDLSMPLVSGCAKGTTPGFIAAQYGHIEIIKYLVENYKVNLTKPMTEGVFKGYSPVMIAAMHGQLDVLQYAKEECKIDLKLPCNSNVSTNKTPEQALLSFIQDKLYACLRETVSLLSSSLFTLVQTKTGLSLAAARVGQVHLLKCLKILGYNLLSTHSDEVGDYAGYIPIWLADPGAQKEYKEYMGYTPAMIAARHGKIEVLKYLQEAGDDLITAIVLGEHKGHTPATLAAQYGQVEVLKYLKENSNADLTEPMIEGVFKGCSPVMIAAMHGQLDVLQYAKEECKIDLKAPLNLNASVKSTPEQVLFTYVIDELKKILEKYEFPIFSPVRSLVRLKICLPLVAARLSQVHLLKCLKTLGYDLAAPTPFFAFFPKFTGHTPASIAAEHNHIAVLEYFHDHCPSINLSQPRVIMSNQTRSLAEVAAEFGSVDTLKYLVKKLVINLSNLRLQSSLVHLASKNGQVGILKCLSEYGVNVLSHLTAQDEA